MPNLNASIKIMVTITETDWSIDSPRLILIQAYCQHVGNIGPRRDTACWDSYTRWVDKETAATVRTDACLRQSKGVVGPGSQTPVMCTCFALLSWWRIVCIACVFRVSRSTAGIEIKKTNSSGWPGTPSPCPSSHSLLFVLSGLYFYNH